MIYQKKGSAFVWVIILVIVILVVGIVAFYFYAINKTPEDYKEIGEQLVKDNTNNLPTASDLEDPNFGWNGGVRSFNSISCENIIRAQDLSEIVEQNWEVTSVTKTESNWINIGCRYSESENSDPGLYIGVTSKFPARSFEKQLENQRDSYSLLQGKSAETNDVGKYYFSYNLDSDSTSKIAEFLTTSEKYWVSILISPDRDEEGNYKEDSLLAREKEIKISRIINDNLEKLN